MYRSVLRLTALAMLFGAVVLADSIAIDNTSSALFSVWSGGRGIFPQYTYVPATNPVTSSTPDPTTSSGPLVQSVSTVTSSASGTSVNVFGSYNSTLYGTGITYSTGPYGSTLNGNPVALTAGGAFTYSNYLGSLPSGATLTDVTLNLSLLIGDPTAGVLGASPHPATASLAGTLGPLSVTLAAGGVTKTVTGTSLNALDLFSDGFGQQLLSGSNLSITFNATDDVTPTVYNSGFSFFSGRGTYLPTETVNLSDTRTLTASNLSNYLTLIYTSTSSNTGSPVVVQITGPSDPTITAVPEPASMLLAGGGLALMGFIFRKRIAR
ncbi:MAG TPA: PEP-CTERM sorting domain-containing protein [Bryobacteraceae bacterium]|nr:PEP-CTERM sorting domain-containing protein [Bryobacteraceae bacterium]